MRNSLLLATLLLLVGAVAASSNVAHVKRSGGMSLRRPRRALTKKPSSKPLKNNNNGTSTNWAGAFVAVDGTDFTQATIKVPEVFIPPGGSVKKTYGGRAWTGIDGVSKKCSAFANAGIQWTIKNNKTNYDAFYQLNPGPTYYFDVQVHVDEYYGFSTSVNGNAATYAILNGTTGDTLEVHTLSSKHPLCTESCEWVVEDYAIDGKLIPFAHFDSVELYNTFGSSPETSAVLAPGLGNSITLEHAGSDLVSCFSTSGSLNGFSALLFECELDS